MEKDLQEQLDNWKAVRYRMREEGMDYCFRHYSKFEEIDDISFHKTRGILIDFMNFMETLVHNRIDELETQIGEIE